MKFHIKTYGCQMNERDSESAAALLIRSGHDAAPDESRADIVIVNTCGVRQKAEEKALGKLGLLIASKRDRPGRLVGAIGCVVEELGRDILAKAPGLDFAVGTRRLAQLPEAVESALAGDRLILAGDADVPRDVPLRVGSPVSAFVNILYGCDRGCSYCVVPAVRGAEWSRPAEDILAEIRTLVSAGVKEVTLLGQSVMSYGRKDRFAGPSTPSPRGLTEPLPRLLEEVNDRAGARRIRFTSGHPSGCTDELALAMAGLPAVCGHLHLPLQSGSDRILDMMRRGYTADDYSLAVRRLRSRVPAISLTTDIIVGFPSESEEEFELTRSFMEEIGFDNAFIFKYSPRPNTAASKLKDDVPFAVKMRRNKILLADQDRRGISINAGLVGTTVEVLIEGASLRNRQRLSGRTRSNKIVIAEPVPGVKAGDIVLVRVERAAARTLYGRIS